MISVHSREFRHRALWVAIYTAAIVAMAYLRFVLMPDQVVPLTYGLPLLLCLVSGSKRANFVMAIIFSVMVCVKAVMLPLESEEEWYRWTVAGMQWTNIWTIALVVNLVLKGRESLEQRNLELQQVNHELEASNEELAAREEEITRQNEELQTQAEELEQQTEELRQQTQEMEHQAAELQVANEALSRREMGLQSLLSSAGWIHSSSTERECLDAICRVACQIMSDVIVGASITANGDGVICYRGAHGLAHGSEPKPFGQAFASIITTTRQSAYIRDIASRPDLSFAASPAGEFRSVLGSPVVIDDRAVAVVELFAAEPRDWTVEEFRVNEWLASQVALAIQALAYHRHLETDKQAAELATLQKSQFLAAVSHDVRTPANAISLLAEMIEQQAIELGEESGLPATARDLKDSARSLVELVSDVLDLARIASGKLDLENTDFPLCQMIQAEVRQQLPQARTKNLRLVTHCPTEGLWLRCDKMKLARVVSNLIHNAIKFTERGEVIVSCKKLPDGSAEIAVRDTGVGIAPEQSGHIFDEFYQIRNPERDRNKGTGLGLAICRRLVDILGCSISLQSVVGTGSTFTVHVPARMLVTGPSKSAPSSDPKASMLSDVRILLVEDHDLTRRAAAHLLSARGAKVFQAGTGRMALQTLTHESPDVVLLDLMLPDMDGSEILRHLSSVPHSVRCVLAVSGDVREERREEVCRLGAHGLVGKPLDIDTLALAIRTHLGGAAKCPA